MQKFDLKSFREENNLTQSDISDKTNIPRTTLSQIETGRVALSNKNRKAIFKAFNLSESDYLPDSKTPKVFISHAHGDSAYEQFGATAFFEMFKEKDKQLAECKDENARLLREIIELKDRINQEREQSKSAPKAPSKHS